ncbi:MAG TPA: hypothetical protein VLD67_12980 [Vicinamibacterales bacterium]|nr:hypothetical protein [Vicinamibacterales bacterium]
MLSAQSLTVARVGDALRVRAPGFGFIQGEPLARLKDGGSVRVELELAVLDRPGASPAARSRRTFVLSYDLWEERFAVAQVDSPSRSISHLTSRDAEAWCLDQLSVPVSALGRLGGDLPLWIRLEYRIVDGGNTPAPDDDTGYTLRGLIDALSRRPKADALTRSIEAGPFRLRE